MDPRSFPTKGNLILAKNSLTLARQGYELMDKKRNILIRELMGLIDEAKDIQEEGGHTSFTIVYEGKEYPIQAGQNFKFDKNGMHSVKAVTPFKMALLLTL